jgi:hypothetical protein
LTPALRSDGRGWLVNAHAWPAQPGPRGGLPLSHPGIRAWRFDDVAVS